MKTLVGILLTMLFSTTSFAGVLMYNGTSPLGVITTLKCSTGLTCTKVGGTVTAVSSPTLTGTSLTLSTTLAVTGNVTVNTNKFTVTAASGNTLIAGTLALTSDLAIATNKFTVTAASGNTVVGGTLGVTSDVAVNTDKFTVAASSGNTVVAGTLTTTGAITATGGIAATTPQTIWMNWKPAAVTTGTSATPSATELYLVQVHIPMNTTLTGIAVNNAATCGTNKYIVALFNSAGGAVANSDLGGTTCSGTDSFQSIPFTGTYAAKGPATYWIGLYVDGTTDRYRAVPAIGKTGGLANKLTGKTFGTVATIAPPTTFTADLGPVAYTY